MKSGSGSTMIGAAELPDRYVDRDTAAVFLSVSARTLATWGSLGLGPRFVKLSAGRSGACRYSLAELRAYMADPAGYRPRPVMKFNPPGKSRVAAARPRKRKASARS